MKKSIKWLSLVLLLTFKTGFADEGYSILQVSELTAEEKEFVQEASDNGELDGFVVKTTQGLFAFHSSTNLKAAGVLINAKPNQCVKVTPNLDLYEKDALIYGVISAKIVNCKIKR
jgi:hypothetical protein